MAGSDSFPIAWRLLRAVASYQSPFYSLSGRAALLDLPGAWGRSLDRLDLVCRAAMGLEIGHDELCRLASDAGLQVRRLSRGPRKIRFAVLDGSQGCDVLLHVETTPPLGPAIRIVVGDMVFAVESRRDVLARALCALSQGYGLWDLRTAHLVFTQGCDLQELFRDLPQKDPNFSPIGLLWGLDHLDTPGDDPDTKRRDDVLAAVRRFGRDLHGHILDAISADLRVS